jgi:hypothetical protein
VQSLLCYYLTVDLIKARWSAKLALLNARLALHSSKEFHFEK